MSDTTESLGTFPPWLGGHLQRILSSRDQGRLGHALLIRGPGGWGQLELANRVTLELLGRGDVQDARGLAHPDLHWVQPEGSVIKVDDIRGLAAFAVGTRQIAEAKVGVVEAADLLNINAANALLKTLEEPPAGTYLILTTSRPARLLPTIVSRCQMIRIEPDAIAARSWLAAHWENDELVERKMFEYGQAPLAVHRALSLEEPLLGPLLAGLAEPGSVADRIAGLLEYPADRLTDAWYRHCVALLAGQNRLGSARSVDRSGLCEFVDELKAVRRQLLFTNSGNPRLLMERLASRWQAQFSG